MLIVIPCHFDTLKFVMKTQRMRRSFIMQTFSSLYNREGVKIKCT